MNQPLLYQSPADSSINKPFFYQDPSPDTSLPNETLETIFQGLAPSTLAKVVRVSRRWRAVAERILYANVFISEHISAISPYPSMTIRCCESIIHHPHLANAVREFHVRWYCGLGDRFPPSLEQVFLVHITDALRRLPALESLELSLGLSKYHLESWRLLHECHFHYVRHFALNNVGTPKLSLSPLTFPSLYSFRGSPPTAASIVPGRPIQSLALVGQDYISGEDLCSLALSSIPLRDLDLSSMSVTPSLLRHVSKHLHTIEFLKMKLALRHTLHFAISGIRLLAALTTVLGAFQNLTRLDLSPTTVDGVGRFNAAEESSLCASWAGVCPSLMQVTFPSKTEWRLNSDGLWIPQSQPSLLG